MEAAEAIEGGVWLGGDAGALTGGKNCIEAFDYEGRMGAHGGREIGLDAEMKIHGAGDEPDTFALGHLRRLFDLCETEDAGVESAGAAFASDGDGDLHVVEAEDWHWFSSLTSRVLREIRHGVGGFHEFFQGGHYGGAGDAVILCDLRGGGAGDLEGFAFGGELRDKANGLRARGVDATARQKQIADKAVTEVALKARDAAEAGNEPEA